MEIMSPAGSFESLHTAIKAGANSIYFGVGKLNMRAQAAKNFTLEDLEKIINICQENNVRSYLTLNTVMYNEDLEEAKKICDKVKALGITSIIASDFSVIQYANSINLNVHISTQANVSNIEAVKFFSKFSDVIVLARELNLEQIKEICNQVQEEQIKGPSGELVKIEIFIHGALCVANSGKCYMSLGLYNTSANRGKCVQPCRRGYKITDEETGKELVLDNKYVMSPKDLCTIKFLDQILDSGVSVLKIEGRGRSPEYVYTVTKVYREAVDAYKEKTYTKEKIESWLEELKSVYNRGFWHGGYYLGNKLGEWTASYGSKATKKKVYLGKVINYFKNVNVGEFILEADEVKVGDEIIILGLTTGIVKEKVKSIFLDEKETKSAKKGDHITIPIKEQLRPNDQLYKLNSTLSNNP